MEFFWFVFSRILADQKNSVFGHFSRSDTDGLQFYLKSAAPRHAP